MDEATVSHLPSAVFTPHQVSIVTHIFVFIFLCITRNLFKSEFQPSNVVFSLQHKCDTSSQKLFQTVEFHLCEASNICFFIAANYRGKFVNRTKKWHECFCFSKQTVRNQVFEAVLCWICFSSTYGKKHSLRGSSFVWSCYQQHVLVIGSFSWCCCEHFECLIKDKQIIHVVCAGKGTQIHWVITLIRQLPAHKVNCIVCTCNLNKELKGYFYL